MGCEHMGGEGRGALSGIGVPSSVRGAIVRESTHAPLVGADFVARHAAWTLRCGGVSEPTPQDKRRLWHRHGRVPTPQYSRRAAQVHERAGRAPRHAQDGPPM